MRFRPPDAECLIYTFKEGLLSAVAHDLELRATGFSVETGETSEGSSPLVARFEAGSLRVVSAMSGGRPTNALSESDRRTIEREIATHVLASSRYPEIRYTARSITGDGDRRRIEGSLALRGHERPLTVEARRDAASGRWHAEVRLHQPDWGIKPYSAMLGTLKIRPEVMVRISLPGSGGGDRPATT